MHKENIPKEFFVLKVLFYFIQLVYMSIRKCTYPWVFWNIKEIWSVWYSTLPELYKYILNKYLRVMTKQNLYII